MGDSPITTPQTPNSEPPTPTTNHTSTKLLNQVSINTSKNSQDVSENGGEGDDGSIHNDSVYAPILHRSHLSVTSSCLSVKSMGSSIVDTDMESIFSKPQIPTSIESKPKAPASKITPTSGIFRASSSCMSVKSMGSSIVDTDMDSIVSKPQIPLSIDGKLMPSSLKKISQDNLEEEENVPSFLTGVEYDRGNKNEPDNDNNSVDDMNDDNISYSSSGRKGGNNVNGDVLPFLAEFKTQIMSQMEEIRSSHHRDTENLIHLLKNESNRRSAVENRLHAQMLLQAETIVAMEIKLLRLEAKLEEKEAEKRRRMVTDISRRRGDELDGPSRRNYADFRGISNETIDEEDTDRDSAAFHVPGEGTMREIQVTTRNHESVNNETQHRSLPISGISREENHHHMAGHGPNPTNMAVISSGVSLASGVTSTSFLEEVQGAEDQVGRLTGVKVVTRDDRSARSDDGDVEDNEAADNEEDDDDDVAESYNDDGSASTPTQGHRSFFADIQPVTNLESILLNPIQELSASDPGLSTRAVRGDYDGASSLATSATNTTAPSTIVTTTTRGNNSVGMRIETPANMDEQGQEVELSTSPTHVELQNMLGLSGSMENICEDQDRHPRSRSQSPLTVQSEGVASIAQQSLASASVGTSVWSTAAVAPTRPIRHRRDLQRGEGRQQWANRVVQFTSDQVFSVPPEISEGGDSITMPDELDNFDVAEDFSNRARAWRMEYEARLDAIQKRFNLG